MLRQIQQLIIVVLLILLIASLPLMVTADPETQSLSFDPGALPQVYGEFFTQIADGDLGTYQQGTRTRSIGEDIGRFFITSLKIMEAGILAAVVLSLVFGVFISRFRAARGFNYILNILASTPDFIIIVASMILAVKFYKMTGIRIISLRPDSGALNTWFPTVLVAIAPTLYLFKLVAVKYYQLSGEDYIRTAVAKGMRLDYINLQHVFKNIEPFILAEMTKVISLGIGNLFIVEYIMNVSGITKFIFQANGFQPIAIGLFAMLLMSLIVYLSIRLLFYLFKRVLIHE
ncbi:ABC transporter permease subunit [Bacillus infantis]|uniref:ABC transporter permease subunit n=1 Tax=Bacillus infantis TaxID=324767 RepID=UPI003CE9D46C